MLPHKAYKQILKFLCSLALCAYIQTMTTGTTRFLIHFRGSIWEILMISIPLYVFYGALLTNILLQERDNLNSTSNCSRASSVLFITQNTSDINIYTFFRIRMQSSGREHCPSFKKDQMEII